MGSKGAKGVQKEEHSSSLNNTQHPLGVLSSRSNFVIRFKFASLSLRLPFDLSPDQTSHNVWGRWFRWRWGRTVRRRWLHAKVCVLCLPCFLPAAQRPCRCILTSPGLSWMQPSTRVQLRRRWWLRRCQGALQQRSQNSVRTCLLHDQRCGPPRNALDLLLCFPPVQKSSNTTLRTLTIRQLAKVCCGHRPAVPTCLHEQPLTCMSLTWLMVYVVC